MRYLGIKPGSLEEAIKKTDEDYQALFKKELKKKQDDTGCMAMPARCHEKPAREASKRSQKDARKMTV